MSRILVPIHSIEATNYETDLFESLTQNSDSGSRNIESWQFRAVVARKNVRINFYSKTSQSKTMHIPNYPKS